MNFTRKREKQEFSPDMETPRKNRAEFQRPPQGEFRARAARKSDDTTEKVQPAGGGGLLMVVSRTERQFRCRSGPCVRTLDRPIEGAPQFRTIQVRPKDRTGPSMIGSASGKTGRTGWR